MQCWPSTFWATVLHLEVALFQRIADQCCEMLASLGIQVAQMPSQDGGLQVDQVVLRLWRDLVWSLQVFYRHPFNKEHCLSSCFVSSRAVFSRTLRGQNCWAKTCGRCCLEISTQRMKRNRTYTMHWGNSTNDPCCWLFLSSNQGRCLIKES